MKLNNLEIYYRDFVNPNPIIFPSGLSTFSFNSSMIEVWHDGLAVSLKTGKSAIAKETFKGLVEFPCNKLCRGTTPWVCSLEVVIFKF